MTPAWPASQTKRLHHKVHASPEVGFLSDDIRMKSSVPPGLPHLAPSALALSSQPELTLDLDGLHLFTPSLPCFRQTPPMRFKNSRPRKEPLK